MRPMADGVGVKDGGLVSSFLVTFLRLLRGVVGGGGMFWESIVACKLSPFGDMASVAVSSDALLFLPLFLLGAVFSAAFPLGTTCSGVCLVGTREERLNDMVNDL